MTDMEMLSAYLDGELPAEVRADFERRLGSEPALAAALERLRQGDVLLRQAVPLPSIDAARLARRQCPRRRRDQRLGGPGMTPWLAVIGIGPDGPAGLSAAARDLIGRAELLVGGARHLAQVDSRAERMAWARLTGPLPGK